MKGVAVKALILCLFYFSLMLAEACFSNIPCDCPSVQPYFDYARMTLVPADTVLPKDGNLRLALAMDSIYFLANNSNHRSFPAFSTSLYGCDCVENGFDGDKYPFTAFNITADQPFEGGFEPGESLDSIFEQVDYDVAYLLSNNNPGGFGKPGIPLEFWLLGRPALLNTPYHFTITIVRTKGDTLRATSNGVIFTP